MDRKEFGEMLESFDRWIATQEREGWQSPKVETHARRVRCALWACAHNNEPHKVTLAMLSEDTEALAKARSQKPAPHQN